MQANETVPRGDQRTDRGRFSSDLHVVAHPATRTARERASGPPAVLLVAVVVALVVGAVLALENLGQGRADRQPAASVVSPDGQSRAIVEQAASLTQRLVEDEALRRRLSDDEFQLLLDWALVKLDESAESCASIPTPGDSSCFSRSSDQLIDLVRIIDLTVGERPYVASSILLDRLQLVESAVEAPLFERDTVVSRRGLLEALRVDSAEVLQTADGRVLMRRLISALD
jgi:hypothetical protein